MTILNIKTVYKKKISKKSLKTENKESKKEIGKKQKRI